jgi:uncharacterized protein YbjT (DUF2867 family)
VVDVANSPSFEDQAVLEFFETSGRNLLAAEDEAGVRHHVALSVVHTDCLQESGYFRGKMVQEKLIKAASIPYTVVRSTQFFEFLGGIAQSGVVGKKVHLSPAFVQPIASDDVASAMADVTLGPLVNGTIEIAGPERVRLDDLVNRYLTAAGDRREVVADAKARYFGATLDDRSLVPGNNPRLGTIGFEQWFRQSASGAAGAGCIDFQPYGLIPSSSSNALLDATSASIAVPKAGPSRKAIRSRRRSAVLR